MQTVPSFTRPPMQDVSTEPAITPELPEEVESSWLAGESTLLQICSQEEHGYSPMTAVLKSDPSASIQGNADAHLRPQVPLGRVILTE